MQAIIFCLAIGHEPASLKMGVVNEEVDSSAGRVCSYTTDCSRSMLSCRFLRFISNYTVVQVNNPIQYSSLKMIYNLLFELLGPIF